MTTTKQLLLDNLIRIAGDHAVLAEKNRAMAGSAQNLAAAEVQITGLKAHIEFLNVQNSSMERALRTLAADAIPGMRKLKVNSKQRLALSASISAAEALAGIPF